MCQSDEYITKNVRYKITSMAVSSTTIYLVLLVLNSASAADDSNAESATKQSRIFGGHPCGEDERYSIIHLRNDTFFICCGSMINNLWGLTAAHCVYKENNYRLAVELVTYQRILVKTIYVHPGYNYGTVENDIAMFYLNRPIPRGKFNYVQLPSRNETICSTLVVKGWGLTESGKSSRMLLCVPLPLYDPSKCQERYKFTNTYSNKVICTLSTEGKDSCGGDSGGPLTCDNVQVGIVSWGPVKCGVPSSPVVYTKVSYFLDFIDATMGKQRKSGVAANGSHFKIVLVSLLVLLIFKYCL